MNHQTADGEFEADDLPAEAASDAAAAAAGQAVVPARKAQKQKAELAEDDDEETVAMKEKLFHPRQIYDKLHSAEPFVCRLGLPPNVTSIFSNDANLDFESFLQLEEDDLISMGVESFGARRRLVMMCYVPVCVGLCPNAYDVRYVSLRVNVS